MVRQWISNLSPTVKIIGIIIILVGAALTWWLASPLFLEGDNINEDLDDPSLEILSSGNLQTIDSTHYGEGLVRLVNTSTGLKLQFVNVNIANGPSLYVYLSDKASFSGLRDTPGNYIDLGSLKATSGSFSYEVSSLPNFEVASVLIWCDPFAVVFSYATLL